VKPLPRLFVFLAAALAAPLAPAACALRVAWAPEAPYAMPDTARRVAGITADLVGEALRRMGCQAQWLEMPWARALAEARAGHVDLIGGVAERPDRRAFLHFSQPLMVGRNLLFSHVDALPALQGMRRLTELPGREFRLGVQIGWAYGGDFEPLAADAGYAARLTQASSRQALWKMVQLRRLDGVIADEHTGRHELLALGLAGVIVPTAIVVAEGAWGMAFSRRTVAEPLVAQFDAAMAAMQREGSFARVIRRYTQAAP
jgi:polar amino acid transport system substrate-binding protein